MLLYDFLGKVCPLTVRSQFRFFAEERLPTIHELLCLCEAIEFAVMIRANGGGFFCLLWNRQAVQSTVGTVSVREEVPEEILRGLNLTDEQRDGVAFMIGRYLRQNR